MEKKGYVLVKKENIPKKRTALVKKMDIYPYLNTRLYPHQRQFLITARRWENELHGGLLGAEMGTGKTLMILSLIADHLHPVTNNPYSTLVVAPLALIHNWYNEINKHLKIPMKRVAIYHGANRTKLDLSECWIVITTYDTVRHDINRWGNESPLITYAAERVILDEAHEIKNSKTAKFQACMQLPGIYRWAMTGTPIHNSQKDLRSLTRFIGLLPYSLDFWWVDLTTDQINDWKENSYIYFSKAQVRLALPAMQLHQHQLDFSEEESITYEMLKTQAKEMFDGYLEYGPKIFSFTEILVKILRLKQLCNHPYAVLKKDERRNFPTKMSTKTTEMMEILAQIPDNEKVLIFSQFTNTLEIIEESLEETEWNDQVLYYHGGLSPGKKEDILTEFDTNPEKRILLISIKSGGVGLNLVQANHVILMDPWWNQAVEEQAVARAHRIGQTKQVHVYRISINNSIEQWINCIQEKKLYEANQLLQHVSSKKMTNFSIEELKQLFLEVTK